LAIIVDKEQKKIDIALACKDLIVQDGMQDLTVSAVAKSAGIGKGTFYEYFESKEDLLFTLVENLMSIHNVEVERRLSGVQDTKEKIKIFVGFFYEDDKEELRKLYRMFMGISSLQPTDEMMEFQTKCFDYYLSWFEELIEQGVKNMEIVPESVKMAKGMFATAKGMFLVSETTNSVQDLEKELDIYFDTLFELLATKEDYSSKRIEND